MRTHLSVGPQRSDELLVVDVTVAVTVEDVRHRLHLHATRRELYNHSNSESRTQTSQPWEKENVQTSSESRLARRTEWSTREFRPETQTVWISTHEPHESLEVTDSTSLVLDGCVKFVCLCPNGMLTEFEPCTLRKRIGISARFFECFPEVTKKNDDIRQILRQLSDVLRHRTWKSFFREGAISVWFPLTETPRLRTRINSDMPIATGAMCLPTQTDRPHPKALNRCSQLVFYTQPASVVLQTRQLRRTLSTCTYTCTRTSGTSQFELYSFGVSSNSNRSC